MLVVALTFLLTLGVQVLVWRVRTPNRDIRMLLLLGIFSLSLTLLRVLWPLQPTAIVNLATASQIGLAFCSLWLAYCEFYLAIKSQSPSSQILLYAARHPQGVLPEDLMAIVADGPAEDARVESLMNAGLARRTAMGFEPTPAGRRLARAMKMIGSLYRLPPTGPKPGEQA